MGNAFVLATRPRKVEHCLQTPTRRLTWTAKAHQQERLSTPSYSPPNLIPCCAPPDSLHSEDRTYSFASPGPTRAKKAGTSRLLGAGFAFANKRVLPIRN